MGVRGLTSYINYNRDAILQNHLLHDSSLVIDGHSLCAQLYRVLNCFSAFGGDYDKFATHTRNFFKHLRKCNITPYVIFDGSYEHRKLRTAYNRLRSKIHGASKLDPVTQGCLQIFPLLLRDVFKEALSDMNVPYTICEFEADDEIAAMARHLNCPVLSYDSDFFIYNVLYIPFNSLDFKPKPIDENGKRLYVLECKIYRVEKLIKHFGGLKEELLPLLATLLGNDFVEKKVFKKFFSQLKLPKSKKKKNDQQRCIHGLFQWLQNETLDTAIAKILGRLKKNRKDKVFAIIKKSIEGYNSKHCRSLKYFNISDEIIEPKSDLIMPKDDNDALEEDHFEEESNGDDSTDNDKDSSDNDKDLSDNDNDSSAEEDTDAEDYTVLGLPEWFAEGIRNNHIPQSILNLYTHHLHFCSPQAEDYTEDDSFLCALPVLRYIFDILTDFSNENCVYVSRENSSSYRRLLLGAEYAISRPLDISFPELSEEQLKFCFIHFVKENLPLLDITELEQLPPNIQLFMICIIWWVDKCEVALGNVHSLLISYIMLEVIDERTGTFRGHKHFNDKYSKKIDEIKKNPINVDDDTDLFLNKNKVQYEDCLIAASVLLKHFELDEKIQKKPKSYDSKKMHTFAQFQCCLQQFNCLNTLCRNPFVGTKYSKSFNGTFVYNIAVKLENQVNPKMFIEQYLRGANTVLKFYKSLCTVYENLAEKMCLKTSIWMGKKKRRRKKFVNDDEISFIMKGFESEVVI